MLSIYLLLVKEARYIDDKDIRSASKKGENFYLRRYRVSVQYYNLIKRSNIDNNSTFSTIFRISLYYKIREREQRYSFYLLYTTLGVQLIKFGVNNVFIGFIDQIYASLSRLIDVLLIIYQRYIYLLIFRNINDIFYIFLEIRIFIDNINKQQSRSRSRTLRKAFVVDSYSSRIDLFDIRNNRTRDRRGKGYSSSYQAS